MEPIKEMDASAMTVFGRMESSNAPRERQDIADREWNAWEWRDVQTPEDAGIEKYIRVKPKQGIVQP